MGELGQMSGLSFDLTPEPEQYKRYSSWVDEQNKIVHQRQKKQVESGVCDWCDGTGAYSPKPYTYWQQFKEWAFPTEPTTCSGCHGDKKYHPSLIVGGQISFEFIPTTVGTYILVKHSMTKNTLDLTDDLDP